MRIVSYCFTISLVTTCRTTLVIYSLKYLVFKFLGIDFLTFSMGYCFGNEHV